MKIHNAPIETLERHLNRWLDAMMEVYGDILQEWNDNDMVRPWEDAKINFKCVNCGKCCNFNQHWVWVYPSDLVGWLKKVHDHKIIPIMLGTLFPVLDPQDNVGYALPSQNVLWDKLHEFIRINKKFPEIKKTLEFLLEYIQKINPSFDKSSDYCIFYDQNKTKHCLIHDHRPVQCKSYPYDYPQFCKISIPKELRKKYGTTEDNLEDLPACTMDAYSGDPTKKVRINEQELAWVIMEKANYLASTITQEYNQEDISEILIELFHRDILNTERDQVIRKDRSGKESKFVAGKRLSGK